jgi:hypothetical protein
MKNSKKIAGTSKMLPGTKKKEKTSVKKIKKNY